VSFPAIDVVSSDVLLDVSGAEVRLVWAATSHTGLVRAENQDSFRAERGVFVVCDGMGGNEGGGRASDVAARSIAGSWSSGCPSVADVFDSVLHANEAVQGQVELHPDLAGMGTTAAGLVAADNGGAATLVVVNIGDSRVYLAQSGTVSQISHDHSVVQELLDSGDISTSDVDGHPERHVITRAIGGQSAQPDLWLLTPEEGQRFLISSDGIHSDVSDAALSDALLRASSPGEAVRLLMALSWESGGRDNATAIVVDVGRCTPHSVVQDETVPRALLAEGPRG
jgi:protein phosphatase